MSGKVAKPDKRQVVEICYFVEGIGTRVAARTKNIYPQDPSHLKYAAYAAASQLIGQVEFPITLDLLLDGNKLATYKIEIRDVRPVFLATRIKDEDSN